MKCGTPTRPSLLFVGYMGVGSCLLLQSKEELLPKVAKVALAPRRTRPKYEVCYVRQPKLPASRRNNPVGWSCKSP